MHTDGVITFAVELLLARVPLADVLLGHQPIKVTERHYSHRLSLAKIN